MLTQSIFELAYLPQKEVKFFDAGLVTGHRRHWQSAKFSRSQWIKAGTTDVFRRFEKAFSFESSSIRWPKLGDEWIGVCVNLNSETAFGISLSLIWRDVTWMKLSPHWQLRRSAVFSSAFSLHRASNTVNLLLPQYTPQHLVLVMYVCVFK